MQICSVVSQNGASAGQATPPAQDTAQRSTAALQRSPSSQSRSLRHATQACRAGWQNALLLPQSALVRHSTQVFDLLSHQGVAAGHSAGVAHGRALGAALVPETPACPAHPAEPLQAPAVFVDTIASTTASPQPGSEAATSANPIMSSAILLIMALRSQPKAARSRLPTCQRRTGAPSSPQARR